MDPEPEQIATAKILQELCSYKSTKNIEDIAPYSKEVDNVPNRKNAVEGSVQTLKSIPPIKKRRFSRPEIDVKSMSREPSSPNQDYQVMSESMENPNLISGISSMNTCHLLPQYLAYVNLVHFPQLMPVTGTNFLKDPNVFLYPMFTQTIPENILKKNTNIEKSSMDNFYFSNVQKNVKNAENHDIKKNMIKHSQVMMPESVLSDVSKENSMIKMCRMENCNKPAAKRTPYCNCHRGVRKCEYRGCSKCAQGRTRFCIGHGGGRRCTYPGCKKAARDKKFCAAHGGGKRCSVEGCNRLALVTGSNAEVKCTAHGGGKRCHKEGCSKSAQSGTNYCVRHGGGKKCCVPDCMKVSRGKTMFCMAHSRNVRPGLNLDVNISSWQMQSNNGNSAESNFLICRPVNMGMIYQQSHLQE